MILVQTKLLFSIYIYYAGWKNRFNEGYRPIIRLDGCYIKKPHPGQLLSAIGINENNQIFPIIFAIVEVETKET